MDPKDPSYWLLTALVATLASTVGGAVAGLISGRMLITSQVNANTRRQRELDAEKLLRDVSVWLLHIHQSVEKAADADQQLRISDHDVTRGQFLNWIGNATAKLGLSEDQDLRRALEAFKSRPEERTITKLESVMNEVKERIDHYATIGTQTTGR